MKQLLVSCDQVFDVLTRGPFPTGAASDESVEHHLRACHECRQLAEALRPAVALMHEAVSAEQAADLPGYQGSLPCSEPREVRLPANRLGQGPARSRQAPSPWNLERFIGIARVTAASILVTAIGLLLYGFSMSSHSNGTIARVRGGFEPVAELMGAAEVTNAAKEADAAEVNRLPTARGLLTLASLRLPANCRPVVRPPLSMEQASALAAELADGTLVALHCCNECHIPKSAISHSPRMFAVLQQNCRLCHPMSAG
jgi:hypothetical protein